MHMLLMSFRAALYCAEVISRLPTTGHRASPVIRAQGVDDWHVDTERLCVGRSWSVGKDLCQSERKGAHCRSALAIAREDVWEDVWSLTARSQSLTFANTNSTVQRQQRSLSMSRVASGVLQSFAFQCKASFFRQVVFDLFLTRNIHHPKFSPTSPPCSVFWGRSLIFHIPVGPK